MKINRIILLSSIAISVHSHAQSLSEALSSGSIKGDFSSTLELGSETDATKEAGANNNSKSLGSAIAIDYTSGSFYNLKMGLGFQTSYDWGIQEDDTKPTNAGGEADPRITITATKLTSAFLEYDVDEDISKTTIRVGRQAIFSPLVLSAQTMPFPMRESFNAIVVENNDFDHTQLKLMYIKGYNKRDDANANGNIAATDKHYKKPLVSLYVANNSIEELKLQAQWLSNHNNQPVGDPPAVLTTSDPYDNAYLSADYHFKDSSWSVNYQMLKTYYKTLSDTGYWGAKVRKGISNNSGLSLSYSSVEDSRNSTGTLGDVPLYRSYGGFTPEIYVGTKVTSIEYDHTIGEIHSVIGYSKFKQSDIGIKNSGADLDGAYGVYSRILYNLRSVKGLSSIIIFGHYNYDRANVKDNGFNFLRASLSYKF